MHDSFAFLDEPQRGLLLVATGFNPWLEFGYKTQQNKKNAEVSDISVFLRYFISS
jgi:hypothetical protein